MSIRTTTASSTAAKSDEAAADDLKDLLVANPGITMGKFAQKAKALEITTAKAWLKAMVEGGFVTEETNGGDEASTYTWCVNGNVADDSKPKPKKLDLSSCLLPVASLKDVPDDTPKWKK